MAAKDIWVPIPGKLNNPWNRKPGIKKLKALAIDTV